MRKQIEAIVAARRSALEEAARTEQLAADRLDLTEVLDAQVPWRGHLHLVQRTRDELEDVFVGMGFAVAEGPEVETDWYNFEALNMPPAHPARGMWDTLYLELGEPETVVLRTHTSPVQIRLMQAQAPPIYAVMPGRCYRRDTPDARHIPTFNQIEGLVVDRGISFADLAGTIETFTGAYFGPGIHSRLRPSYFPFTEPSAEFEITCTICGGRRLPDLLPDGLDRARGLRDGRPGRLRRRGTRRRGVVGLRLRLRDRPAAPRCATRSPTCGSCSRTTSAC